MYPKWLDDRLVFEQTRDMPPGTLTLLKVTYDDKPCGHCNRTIKQEQFEMRYMKETPSQNAHKRTQCINCDLCYNTLTSKFELTAHELKASYSKRKKAI